jgi:hypothetical protein
MPPMPDAFGPCDYQPMATTVLIVDHAPSKRRPGPWDAVSHQSSRDKQRKRSQGATHEQGG